MHQHMLEATADLADDTGIVCVYICWETDDTHVFQRTIVPACTSRLLAEGHGAKEQRKPSFCQMQYTQLDSSHWMIDQICCIILRVLQLQWSSMPPQNEETPNIWVNQTRSDYFHLSSFLSARQKQIYSKHMTGTLSMSKTVEWDSIKLEICTVWESIHTQEHRDKYWSVWLDV